MRRSGRKNRRACRRHAGRGDSCLQRTRAGAGADSAFEHRAVGREKRRVRKEDEDEEDEDILPEPKEWKITVFNESDMGEEQCAAIRKNGGVILLIPFGNDVSRKTERMLSFLKNQDCNVYGIIVTEADEEYLNRYFA